MRWRAGQSNLNLQYGVATVLLALYSLPLPARAQTSQTAGELQQQVDELTRRYQAEIEELRQLKLRIKQLQSDSPAPQPAKALAAAEPPRQAEAQREAEPPQSEKAAAQVEPATVRQAPAARSTEAIYQEQHAIFDLPLTFETSFTYSHFDRKQLNLSGFLALDSIFLGNIHVDTVKADILTLGLAGRYTLSDRVQVDLSAPFLYRNTNYSSGGAGSAAAVLSEHNVIMNPTLGDMSAGVYYHLFREMAGAPDVVANARVKAPTGSNPYGIKLVKPDPNNNNLVVPQQLPSGNGLWAVSGGLSFVKTVDPAILFANVNYYYNFPRHFSDISTSVGSVTPGEIKLGDSFEYGLGCAFALNERMSLSLGYSERFTNKSRTRVDGQAWADVIGSDADAASLNFGSTYSLGENRSVVVNIASGITPDAPNTTVSLKYLKSF